MSPETGEKVRNASTVLALTAASAALCLLCVHPREIWPFALVAWCPFILAVARLDTRWAVALGLLHGVLVNAGALSWAYPALREVGQLSVPSAGAAFTLLVVVQGARSALIALLFVLGRRRGWPTILVFPLSLVTSELVMPSVFPWHTALFTQPVIAWMQLAELGGPLMVSGWVAVVNAAFAEAWLGRRRGRHAVVQSLAVALGVLALVTVFGTFRIRAIEARAAQAESARIGVVQVDLLPLHLERRDTVKLHRDLSLELLAKERGLDLVVWPETAVTYATPSHRLPAFFRDAALRDRREGIAGRRIDVPLLAGMVLSDGAGKAGRSRSNSAVLSDPTGRVLGRYDKQTLVPIGERPLPDWVRLPLGIAPESGQFTAGDAAQSLPLSGHRLGVSVCYEDMLHREIRSAVSEGRPDLLINLSSDAWFAGSHEPGLHLALAAFRAVEHRRYLVRASTGGATAVIAPTGRIEWRLPEGPASGAASVRWLDVPTPYESFGDAPSLLAAVLSVALAFVRRRRARAASRRTEREALLPTTDRTAARLSAD